MAAIYQADIFCDDCADRIKDHILGELWEKRDSAECPDGMDCKCFETIDDLSDHLESMHEWYYDSDDYPKGCSDDGESDCPQHCGSGCGCENYGEMADGFRYGCLISTNLTTDGVEYVKEAVREGEPGGVAREVWALEFDWIDFEEDDDYDD